MPRAETWAIVLIPVAAMATFALGLRVGAASPVRGALVYAAPPSAGRPGLAWQLMTVREERGVREAIPVDGLSVVARAGGRETVWQGETNSDGIAEVWLDLATVRPGDAVDLSVRAKGDVTPLAEGRARWESEPWGPGPQTSPWVQASKLDGDIALAVAVYGQKLAPGFATSLWVLVRDRATGQPITSASVDAEAEPGLDLATPTATTCANGWAELVATAQMHVVGLSLHAAQGERRRGEWFGTLPVAPGGTFVAAPTEARPDRSVPLIVDVPTVRPLLYVEVDDAQGRAFAAALKVSASPGTMPSASVLLPPLSAGTYWVVTAGEPRGAEALELGAIARPLLLRDGDPLGHCEAGARLAVAAAAPFRKWLALDGMSGKRAVDDGRRSRGLVLAWGALAVAAVLEAMLLLRATSRARKEMAAVEAALADGEAVAPRLASRFSAANLLIGILLVLLGFALVGSLLTLRGG
jgi:hypothetical protein